MWLWDPVRVKAPRQLSVRSRHRDTQEHLRHGSHERRTPRSVAPSSWSRAGDRAMKNVPQDEPAWRPGRRRMSRHGSRQKSQGEALMEQGAARPAHRAGHRRRLRRVRAARGVLHHDRGTPRAPIRHPRPRRTRHRRANRSHAGGRDRRDLSPRPGTPGNPDPRSAAAQAPAGGRPVDRSLPPLGRGRDRRCREHACRRGLGTGSRRASATGCRTPRFRWRASWA